jgi:1-acyl-sn-glycerol-3-phosphate acyltransferase
VKFKFVYYAGWSLTRIITKLVFRIKVRGSEHIPARGGFILASNHRSWYDPLIVGSWSTRQMYFFAKQELFKNKIFGALIRAANAFPVKRGTIDRAALEMCQQIVRDGNGLVFFPEGTRAIGREFLDPKPGIGLLATELCCPIVPCYLHGSNKLGDALWGRDRLSIRFGEPISPEWISQLPKDKVGYQIVADEVMRRMRGLRDEDYPQ